jgi:hypothetical protein
LSLLGTIVEQVTFNAADVDHSRRANHHQADPKFTTDGRFVIIERAFDSPDSGFDRSPELRFSVAIGSAALAAESNIKLSLSEAKG